MNAAHLRPVHVRAALEVLDGSIAASAPTDVLLRRLFQTHRQMGGRDRAAVSDLVYGVLRKLRELQWRTGRGDPEWLAARLLSDAGVAADRLAALGLPDPRLAAPPTGATPAAVRLNLPDDWYERWLRRYGPEETEALAAALNSAAPVDLRVNSLRSTRSTALTALQQQGVEAVPTPLAPLGLRLAKRLPLQNLPEFRAGWVEPQDEGSQLLALLPQARPGEAVADYCAGAGGKTLALAAQMQNRGRLHACDIAAARLAKLPPRAARAGITCITTWVLGATADQGLGQLAGTMDAVLVDAPCSASGVLRRNPELRLRSPDLAQLAATQSQVLEAAAGLVKPQGRLVYATCSLFEEENQNVVQRFLAQHPDFFIQDAGRILQDCGVPYDGQFLELLPHRHGTDGFFAAALSRRA